MITQTKLEGKLVGEIPLRTGKVSKASSKFAGVEEGPAGARDCELRGKVWWSITRFQGRLRTKINADFLAAESEMPRGPPSTGG